MEALLTSTISVAIAEIGDKTQLLALLLICRFRKPWPIIAGMLAATLLNHAGAAWIGEFISRWMDSKVMTWLVAGAFIAMAAWTLVPDKLDRYRIQLAWNHRDVRGDLVASGIYLWRIVSYVKEKGRPTPVMTNKLYKIGVKIHHPEGFW